MDADRVFPQNLREGMGDPFRQPPRVDEDQRAAVRGDQLGQTGVELGPLLVHADRPQFAGRDLHVEIELPLVADVHNRRHRQRNRRRFGRRRLGRSPLRRSPRGGAGGFRRHP